MFIGIEQYLLHILVEKWLLRITLRELRSSEEKKWKNQILIKILKEKERGRIRKIREMQKLESQRTLNSFKHVRKNLSITLYLCQRQHCHPS